MYIYIYLFTYVYIYIYLCNYIDLSIIYVSCILNGRPCNKKVCFCWVLCSSPCFFQVFHLSCLSFSVWQKYILDIEHVSRTTTVHYQISYDILRTYYIIYIISIQIPVSILYLAVSHPGIHLFVATWNTTFFSTSPTTHSTSLKAESLPEVTSEIEDQGPHWGCAQWRWTWMFVDQQDIWWSLHGIFLKHFIPVRSC